MFDLFDVGESFDLRPLILKDGVAIIFDLALEYELEPRTFESEIEPTDS